MPRLSKDERKRMREQANESIRQADFFHWVMSPKATADLAAPDRIVEEAGKVGVNLAHRRVSDDSHAFCVPEGPKHLCVVLGYGAVDRELLTILNDYEWLVQDRSAIAVGMPVIAYRAKIALDPVIQLVAETVKRVLGRLAGGTWASSDLRTVMDDWLSWSCDYLGPDMVAVNKEFAVVFDLFPQLRRHVSDVSGKAW